MDNPRSPAQYKKAALKKGVGKYVETAQSHMAKQHYLNMLEDQNASGLSGYERELGMGPAPVARFKRVANGSKSRTAGLAKGQNLMQQAAKAYHAGEYDSMQDALRGVAAKRRR
jgi:hypothetical protein